MEFIEINLEIKNFRYSSYKFEQSSSSLVCFLCIYVILLSIYQYFTHLSRSVFVLSP